MKRRGSKLLANTTTTRNNTSSSSAQSSYSSGAKRIKVENVRILLDRSVSSELLIDKIRDVRDKAERILYPILMFLKEKFKTEEWDTKIMYDKIDVIILKSQLDLVRDGNYIFTFFLKYYNIFEGLAFSEFANAGNPFDVLSTMQPRFKRLSSILHLRNCKKFIELSFRYGVSVELSTENKNDRDVVMKAVVADGHLLQNFAEKFRNDRKVVLNAIYNDNGPGCQVFKLVSDNLKNDREFVLKAVQLNHCVFGEAPKCFRDDKEIAIDAVNQNGRNLEYVSINLENDREVLLSARNLDRGEYKITLTEEIMKDREFMLEFISRNPKCLAYSKHFWKDRDFLFEIMELDGMALSISNEFRNDKEIVLQAVRQNGEALKFASKELREDRDVIMAAVERSGLFILSEYKEGSIESGTELYLTNLKNNREIALRSIQMSCFQIRYISDELRNDRSFIFDAVQVNGKVLEYLSEKFKNDKEIVLQAVRQNGEALKFASKELRADREVAMEAVKENGKAIYFSRCKAKELYLEAVKTHPVDVLEEISDDLYFDFEIAKTIVEYWDVTEYHFEMQHWTTIY